jgi:hypothetical protein
MPVPSGPLSDLFSQHPVIVSTSVVGAITMAGKICSALKRATLKGLQGLLEILRAFCNFLLGAEIIWHEYQEARPRKNRLTSGA